jgi:hypothetical protein
MAFYTETITIRPKQLGLLSAVSKLLKAFGRGILNTFESIGRARAAGELHRMGYTEEAKSLMLREYEK